MSATSPDIDPRPRDSAVVGVVAGAVIAVIAVVAVAALLVVALHRGETAGTIGGSGVAIAQPRTVPPFTSVRLAGSNIVRIHVGTERSVVVHADRNLVRRVTTNVEAEQLVIGTRGSVDAHTPMYVDVAVPRLTSVAVSGSGTVEVDGISSDAFAVALPGSGTIDLAGAVGRLDATIEGSGAIRARPLIATRVTATIPGSGSIDVTATERLVARIGGSGSITCAGSPAHVSRIITGTGSIDVI